MRLSKNPDRAIDINSPTRTNLDQESSAHVLQYHMATKIANLHSCGGNHHEEQVPFEERESAFVHSHIFPIKMKADTMDNMILYSHVSWKTYKQFQQHHISLLITEFIKPSKQYLK